MPLQNRVTPFGEIVATAARGTMMGNRGILHDARQRLGRARWGHPHWVACVLAFRGRSRAVMQPGAYTELFFLDEAVALAAGHRPCGYCRRADFNRFRDLWRASVGQPVKAPGIDAVLHAQRLGPRPGVDPAALPDGAFVAVGGVAALRWSGAYLRYSPAGYTAKMMLDSPVTLLTPAAILPVLAAGYRPVVHPSAEALAGARA
jgi:hypothetical protein